MRSRKKDVLLGLLLMIWVAACAKQPASPQPTDTLQPEPTAQVEDLAPAGLVESAQEFVNRLVQEDFASAEQYFDDTMKAALPAGKLQETWQGIVAQVGAFREQIDTRTESEGEYTSVFVTCQFEQAALDARVVFDRSGQIAGLFFVPTQSPEPQEYVPPAYTRLDAFEEKEIVVGSDEWALPGTLTLPQGEKPFPAVVLVHGSGPQDRDESIGPNKPFRDLAWGLASRGVAVLRYEKRTLTHQARLAAIADDLTVGEETVEDALAALSMLRQTEGIDPNRVFLLGHSLGGMLAPCVAGLDPDVAGLIVLAGTSRPLEDVILEQTTYIFSLDGDLSDEEKATLDELERQVAWVKSAELSAETPASDLPLGIPAAYWLDLRDYDPAEVAKGLSRPMLILQGGRDYQVTTEDFEGWQVALSSRADVAFKLYPSLNHLFIAGEGPGTPAEYEIAGHVAEEVVDDIASWIISH